MAIPEIHPNLFIVGAAKAGTTALYYCLSQHPDIFMSQIKEPHHFLEEVEIEKFRELVQKRLKTQNLDEIYSNPEKFFHRAYIQDREQYLALFKRAKGKKYAGEASPSYLYSKKAASEIYKFNPESKIIIILRNPVERAYSHYLMDRKLGFTTDEFSVALEKDLKASYRRWGTASLYMDLGQYSDQVKRYLDIFPANQVHILLTEELFNNTKEEIRKILMFLELDPDVDISYNLKKNMALIPRSKWLSRNIGNTDLRMKIRSLPESSIIKKFIRKIFFKKPQQVRPLPEVYEELKKSFTPDIIKLSGLIHKDLSQWM